jgi:hypothetical protein
VSVKLWVKRADERRVHELEHLLAGVERLERYLLILSDALNLHLHHVSALFRCPVAFDAKGNCMIFSLADLKVPLPTSNPILAELHDRFAGDYLRQFDHAQTSFRAREVILKWPARRRAAPRPGGRGAAHERADVTEKARGGGDVVLAVAG